MLAALSRNPFLRSVSPALTQARKFRVWPPKVHQTQDLELPVEKTVEKAAQVFKQSHPKADQKSKKEFSATRPERQEALASALEALDDFDNG
jgi:hypothetical protein